MARVSRKRLREMIHQHRGNISAVADAFNRSRQTIYNWIEKYELQDEHADAKERVYDMAVSRLEDWIEAGELRAIFFYLETQGKNRGWSKRQEITGRDGESLFGEEARQYLDKLGIDEGKAVAEFVEILRREAEKVDG